MDKSIDPKVAEALMYAWRARDVLGLPQQTVDLIADRISRCAHGPFFRYPSVRLNQINWNCELYAHTATVTGDTELLRLDYRAQVERFSEGIRRRLQPGGSPNLGPGYRFHYLPGAKPWHPYNLDSAEYASETCHFVLHYEAALRAGMQPIAPEYLTLLRAWIEHVVYAYWTHGGYLNWDTGYGFKRWHAGRTWALAQQGLLAIATSPRFHNVSDLGAWAKYFFDRGLQLFERLSRRGPRRPRHRAGEPLRRRRAAARAEHPRDVRGADAGERGARSGAGPGEAAGDRAAVALFLRRRHRAPCDHDACATTRPCWP